MNFISMAEEFREIDFDELRKSGIFKPPYEFEKAHTFPVSQPFWYSMDTVDWREAKEEIEHQTDSRAFRIYIHVPYCRYRCKFCFYDSIKLQKEECSIPASAFGYEERCRNVDEYLERLEEEIRKRTQEFGVIHNGRRVLPARDLYIGGGTPTSLSSQQFEKLLRVVSDFIVPAGEVFGSTAESRSLPLSEKFVATCECTPDTIIDAEGKRKIEIFTQFKIKITRASLGMQSCREQHLRTWGRGHTVDQAKEALHILHKSGIDHVNVDVIYGLESETLNDWKKSLNEMLTDMDPESWTFYYLRYAPGTMPRRDVQPGEWELLTEMRAAYMDDVSQRGYQMCRPHFYRKSNPHIQRYRGAPCLDHELFGLQLGFGPAAYSHLAYTVFRNTPDICDWMDKVHAPNSECAVSEGKRMTEPDRRARYLIRSLFNTRSQEEISVSQVPNPTIIAWISARQFKETFHISLDIPYGKKLAELRRHDLIQEWLDPSGDRCYALTPRGWLVDEEVLYHFYPDGFLADYTRGFGTASLELHNAVAAILDAFRKHFVRYIQKAPARLASRKAGEYEQTAFKKALGHAITQCETRFFGARRLLESQSREAVDLSILLPESLVGDRKKKPEGHSATVPDALRERDRRLTFDRVLFSRRRIPHFGSISIHEPLAPASTLGKIDLCKSLEAWELVPEPTQIGQFQPEEKMRERARKWVEDLLKRVVTSAPQSQTDSAKGRALKRQGPVKTLGHALQQSGISPNESLPDSEKEFFQQYLTKACETRQSSFVAEICAEVPLIMLRDRTKQNYCPKGPTPSCEFLRRPLSEISSNNYLKSGEYGFDTHPINNIFHIKGQGWDEVIYIYMDNVQKCNRMAGCEQCRVFTNERHLKAVDELLTCILTFREMFSQRTARRCDRTLCYSDAVEFILPFVYLNSGAVLCSHCPPSDPKRRGGLSYSLALDLPTDTEENFTQKEFSVRWLASVAVALDALLDGIMTELSKQDIAKEGERAGLLAIGTVLGHEVFKGYKPVISVLDSRPPRTEAVDITDLAGSALKYGILNTPTRDPSWMPKDKEDTVRIAWQSFLLREVLGVDFRGVDLNKRKKEIRSLWYYPPAELVNITGELTNWVEAIKEESVTIGYWINQILLILLTNAFKHHYQGLINIFADSAVRIYDFDASRVKWKERGPVVLNMDFPTPRRSGRVFFRVTNFLLDGPSEWLWDKGTPLALDTICGLIYEALGQVYKRYDVINWSRDGSLFSIDIQMDIVIPNRKD